MSPTQRALFWALVTILLTVCALMLTAPARDLAEQWPSYNGDLVEVTNG